MKATLKLAILALFLLALPGLSQNPPIGTRFTPKLEPIAETKLLMEGLAHANFRGLERILGQQEKEIDDRSWVFARGQALLIAETANLLMIRPPRKDGQQAWFERAMEVRGLASNLASSITRKDVQRSRMGLQTLANSCNRCHQTFRVNVQIVPFEEETPPRKAD